MAEKEPKGLLDIIANYKHLANPFHALLYPGAGGRAPEGKYRLAKRDGTNLALWNALGVASWAVPTAALAAYFTNKWWDKKMHDATNKSVVSRISMVRPSLSPDSDLENISEIVEDPSRELNAIKAMLGKKASGDGRKDDSTVMEWIKNIAVGALPLYALPASALAAKFAVDKLYARNMRKRLEAERIAIQNHQNAIDHAIMTEQGLIKGASEDDDVPWWRKYNPFLKNVNPAFKEKLDKANKDKEDRRGAFSAWFGAPVLGITLTSGLLAALAYNYLGKHDKDKETLEYLRKKSLGHNVMQHTPEIGLEQFGIPVTDIVARPGDKKQPGYVDVVDAEVKEVPVDELKTAQLLENLEELKPAKTEGNVSEESKKEDALF
jgi:hypothetical protein